MLAVLSPIIVFGLVIFVHELGHFIAAKSVGVYAPRFSIGFGPALWRKRRGETEYILAAFPLGGYVRMASRLDEATAGLEGGTEEGNKLAAQDPNFDPNAMIPFGPKPVPEHRWFESKPLWARLYILVAGVTMNFILGLVVAIGLAMHFGKPVITTRVVGSVLPIDGRPVLAAVQPGDSIVSVNGEAVASWNDVVARIGRATDSLVIATNRATVTIPLDAPGAPTPADVAGALDYRKPPVIGALVAGEPGAKAGLEEGDTVRAIDGRRVDTWSDMVVLIARSGGKEITLDLAGRSGRRTIAVTPRPQAGVDPVTGIRGEVGKLGAYPPDISTREPVSLGEASVIGTRAAWFMGTSVFTTVRDLFSRPEAREQIGGPIAIVRASVQAARSGLENWFYLIAVLSINVGILNLLPIPVLDGGNILINVVESVRRKPLTLQTREYILRGGLLVILLIFVFATRNDVLALLR